MYVLSSFVLQEVAAKKLLFNLFINVYSKPQQNNFCFVRMNLSRRLINVFQPYTLVQADCND